MVLAAAVGFVAGFLFVAGLGVSGIAQFARNNHFFTPQRWLDGHGDPALLFIFSIALCIAAVWMRMSFSGRVIVSKPLLRDDWSVPTISVIDWRLIGGGIMFGTGWAICGSCCGPALSATFGGSVGALVTSATQLTTWLLCRTFGAPASNGVAQPSWGALLRSRGFLVYVALLAVLLVAYMAGDVSKQPNVVRNGVMSLSLANTEFQRVLVGATLMGTAVGVLMLFTGYPLGIAGLYREAMAPTTTDRGMRVAFIAGGLMASLFLRLYHPIYVLTGNTRSIPVIVIGSVLVACGSFLGNGCTSGHGLTGLSRFSRRSSVFIASLFGSALASSAVFEALFAS